MEYIIATFVFLVGLAVGSFLNVLIYRIPLSIPFWGNARSNCARCGHLIAFYDNIPLINYLILRGRCRHCHEPFAFRYFIIELVTAFFALECYLIWGLSPMGGTYFLFIAVLIVVTFVDIDYGIIPDYISLPGIVIFFVLAWWFIPQMTLSRSILGVIFGGGILFLVGLAYRVVTGRDGMGGGDVKLLAMIGAVIGWQGILFTIFTSSLVGALAGFILMLRARTSLSLSMPYGPFLSVGAIIFVFFGDDIITWYMSRLTF